MRIRPFFLFSVAQLGSQIARQPYRPPFTLAVMAAQTLIYLRPNWLLLLVFSRKITDLYMIPAAVVEGWALKRLFLSSVVHADHYHLYYNCATMLWQGTQLESRMGTLTFAKLVGNLLATSHAIFVALTWLVSFLGFDRPYYNVSLGFSNVLFALKMVMCYELPGGVAQVSQRALPRALPIAR